MLSTFWVIIIFDVCGIKNWVGILFSPLIFWFQLHYNLSLQVIFDRFNLDVYQIVITYWSFYLFCFVKIFILYIFGNVLNRAHFIQNSYVENVPENSKMKGVIVKTI